MASAAAAANAARVCSSAVPSSSGKGLGPRFRWCSTHPSSPPTDLSDSSCERMPRASWRPSADNSGIKGWAPGSASGSARGRVEGCLLLTPFAASLRRIDPARRDRHRNRVAAREQGPGRARRRARAGADRALLQRVAPAAVGRHRGDRQLGIEDHLLPGGVVRALAARPLPGPVGGRRHRGAAVAGGEVQGPRQGRRQAGPARPVLEGPVREGQSAPRRARNAPPIDDDMAEIEALLKSRGIE